MNDQKQRRIKAQRLQQSAHAKCLDNKLISLITHNWEINIQNYFSKKTNNYKLLWFSRLRKNYSKGECSQKNGSLEIRVVILTT